MNKTNSKTIMDVNIEVVTVGSHGATDIPFDMVKDVKLEPDLVGYILIEEKENK